MIIENKETTPEYATSTKYKNEKKRKKNKKHFVRKSDCFCVKKKSLSSLNENQFLMPYFILCVTVLCVSAFERHFTLIQFHSFEDFKLFLVA